MRDYAKVSPKFWIGPTGKSIRKQGTVAQVLALYLLTSPHANMLGIYHLPVAYISADTGIPLEGAFEGLRSLSEAGFCGYDESSEVVFVYEMARYQIGEQLKPKDNQVEGVRREYRNLPENSFLLDFFQKYSAAFHLEEARGLQAPTKPLGSKEQEQEQEKEKTPPAAVPPPPKPTATKRQPPASPSAPPAAAGKPSVGTRLPEDWQLPKPWGEWAAIEQPTWTADHIRKIAAGFRDHWVSKPGPDARKLDWEATWRNWVRREKPLGNPVSVLRPEKFDPIAYVNRNRIRRDHEQDPLSTIIDVYPESMD